MDYEYLGYLSTILYKPDSEVRESLDHLTFSGEDLAKWKTDDLRHATEWQKIPARRKKTKDGVHLEGDFRNVRSIDSLSPTDPRYWVPISSLSTKDDRFPIDTSKYPVIEITYRCTSEMAHPTWLWTYDGGSHFGSLPKTKQWKTVARMLCHFGFPEEIGSVIIRLYSSMRSVESMEIKSIRFRAMSETEQDAMQKSYAQLDEHRLSKHFPILEEFMPLGVYMDAESAKRLARMLKISQGEYWDLVMEDLATHHHNAIALAHIDLLESDELNELLKRCESHGIKLVARHEFPLDGQDEDKKIVIDKHIVPFANSNALFAHTFSGEPIESDFQQVLAAKDMMEEADPNHPVALVARYPNAYPLFAPFFAASGVGHFASRRPWDVGRMVRKHIPLSAAQQFWVAAPTFMYPTQTPEWSTSPEMRLMVNLAFANGARGWFSYSYHNDPVWFRGRVQRTLTGPFLTFSDIWLELMQRMKGAGALAPLFLKASLVNEIDDWFAAGVSTDSTVEPSPGIPPISLFHLRGPDFSLYTTVSNNTREMVSVNVDLPSTAASGQGIHDLTKYVSTRKWEPMPRRQHIEMFPGQAQIVLVAEPACASHWRDIIASRLVADDLRRLQFNLELAQQYGLGYGPIEKSLNNASKRSAEEELTIVHKAKDALIDLIYAAPEIVEARNSVIETSSIICACDGALCRLLSAGMLDEAGELGGDVIPMAAEFTALRIEIRKGNGAAIAGSAADLSRRAHKLLEKIRALN